jgi:RNA polymerase sigma-70 factor (ECF subfamily)
MSAALTTSFPLSLAPLRAPSVLQPFTSFVHLNLLRHSSFDIRHSTVDTATAPPQTIPMDPADSRDISLTTKGDGDAYQRLIHRHQQAVTRRMAKFSTNPAQLEELTHDVFVEAFFSLRSFRGEAPFSHWLMGIATRVGYKFWKQQTRARQREPLPEIPFETPEIDDSLAPVLAQLSPRDRIVVTLLYLEEKTVAETAAILKWSQTMVKVQSFRARAKLRKLMEAQNPK